MGVTVKTEVWKALILLGVTLVTHIEKGVARGVTGVVYIVVLRGAIVTHKLYLYNLCVTIFNIKKEVAL